MNRELFSFQTYEMQGGNQEDSQPDNQEDSHPGNQEDSQPGNHYNEIVGGISVQKYLKSYKIQGEENALFKKFNNSIVPVGLLVNTIGPESYSSVCDSDSSSDSSSDNDSDNDSYSSSGSDNGRDNKITRASKSKYNVVNSKSFDYLLSSVATDLGKSRSKSNTNNKTKKHLVK